MPEPLPTLVAEETLESEEGTTEDSIVSDILSKINDESDNVPTLEQLESEAVEEN